MCQLCDEANLYMAQLEAADRKAADARKGGAGQKGGATPAKPGTAASTSGGK